MLGAHAGHRRPVRIPHRAGGRLRSRCHGTPGPSRRGGRAARTGPIGSADPRLGGLAIPVLAAAALWLPSSDELRGILGGAALITVIGAVDDAVELRPHWKLLGQIAAAILPVAAGVQVENFTLRGPRGPRRCRGPADRAGPRVRDEHRQLLRRRRRACGRSVRHLRRHVRRHRLRPPTRRRRSAGGNHRWGGAGVPLFFNFHPASVFMGDSGSNLLGLLLGCIAVQGIN